MNYQVKWNEDGKFENVHPDGYGMHVDASGYIRAKALGASNCVNAIFAVTHDDLLKIKTEYDGIQPDATWTEWSRDAREKDYRALVKAIDAAAERKIVLRGTDEDGDYFFVLDDSGDVLFEQDRDEYSKIHDADCESCWNPETGDPDVWFAAIFEQGAYAARCGSGCVDQYEWTADEFAQKHAQV